MWLEIGLSRIGTEIQVSVRGSRGEQIAPRLLGAGFDVEALRRFALALRSSAQRSRPLSSELLEKAQALHRALLGGEVDALRARLAEAAAGPVVVRLMIPDPDLQAVPWESLCKPGEALGFWASSPDLLPVRGVHTTEPWQPRAVRGPLRLLAIAPQDTLGVKALKSALAAPIAAGEIEWLEPLAGAAADATGIQERLRSQPVPHVLHFLGHGGLQDNIPILRVADDEDGNERVLPVEILAQQLKANLRGFLRLVVLEACEGARSASAAATDFASAAELLGRAGADAVVAHLWPVAAEVARAGSAQLYSALAGAQRTKGDIAAASNEARRAILGASQGGAQAFSLVVYLRGPDGVLFDFKDRKLTPPEAAPAPRPSGLAPAVSRLLAKPFSLILGDRSREQRRPLEAFRDRLHKELAKAAITTPPTIPMSMLAQRFALYRGEPKLGAEFQKTFRSGAPPPAFIEALARVLSPGVHTTLLRYPWLELCAAEHQPERTIYVIQPGEEGTLILRRAASEADWEEIAAPEDIDAAKDIILFRPYGGYTPEHVFSKPLLTEDDYVFGTTDIESALPRDLANEILGALCYRPALLLGLSVHTSHHRMLMQRLYPRGIPRGSLAVLDPEEGERALWEKGAGLPGKREGAEVLEASPEDFGEMLASSESPS